MEFYSDKIYSDIPPHPWHTLGFDMVYFKKMDFLVVIDHFSSEKFQFFVKV